MTDPSSPERHRRLGRGLDALISNPAPTATTGAQRIQDLPIHLIDANRHQPRRDFAAEELKELQASMRDHGLIQPISVRVNRGGFELIAGERRLRAARQLGWSTIPAIVRQSDESQLLVLALVENLQREDLNPIDEAEGYQRLIVEFGYTQQRVADAVAKDRSTVANLLRLLNLPAAVQQLLRDGTLSEGHGRALLSLESPDAMVEIAREASAKGLTVRDIERLGSTSKKARQPTPRHRSVTEAADPQLRYITDRLRRYLQTDVHLVADAHHRGEMRIRFYSAEDLDRLTELIIGSTEDGS